eukprot:COSAG04_NODE_2425_length_4143_cov_810.029674_2_plen_72_part_00
MTNVLALELPPPGPAAVSAASGGSLLMGAEVSAGLILYCALVFFTVFGLFGYHVTLVRNRQKTNSCRAFFF